VSRRNMIARIWKGAVRKHDGDAYARYMQENRRGRVRGTPGNRGVWMLRRDVDDRTEFVMFTLWDSLEAVRAFAGDDLETAVFYPEDDRFLVERDLTAAHYRSTPRSDPTSPDRRATRRPGPATSLPQEGFRPLGGGGIVVVGSGLLLDVAVGRSAGHRRRCRRSRSRPQPSGPPVMPGQFRELLPQPSGRDALEGVHQPG
jgi:heme-degrading monooxygenase HmoA